MCGIIVLRLHSSYDGARRYGEPFGNATEVQFSADMYTVSTQQGLS